MTSRIVAPIPPARMKPAPSAAAVATGSLPLSFPLMFVASPSPARRPSTATARRPRSASMSGRPSAADLPLRVAIALQRLRRELRLADRLLGNGRGALLQRAQRQPAEGHCEGAGPAGADKA